MHILKTKVLPGDIYDDRRYLKFRERPWAQAAGEEEGPELGAGMTFSASGEQGGQLTQLSISHISDNIHCICSLSCNSIHRRDGNSNLSRLI